MILAGLADIVQVPFGWLLDFLYQLTTNYGVSLIIFAFLVKIILMPATAKAKKSSMKMQTGSAPNHSSWSNYTAGP